MNRILGEAFSLCGKYAKSTIYQESMVHLLNFWSVMKSSLPPLRLQLAPGKQNPLGRFSIGSMPVKPLFCSQAMIA
jgi:hypothetical protein